MLRRHARSRRLHPSIQSYIPDEEQCESWRLTTPPACAQQATLEAACGDLKHTVEGGRVSLILRAVLSSSILAPRLELASAALLRAARDDTCAYEANIALCNFFENELTLCLVDARDWLY